MMILMRIHQYTYADTLKLQILFEQLKHQLTNKELGIFSLSKSSTPNRSWFTKRELVLYHFLADQTSKSPSQALLIQLIN